MPTVLVNDSPAFDVVIRRPLLGAWTADMRVDTDQALAGRAQVVIGDGLQTLIGTVSRGGPFLEHAQVRVVGGAGGLAKTTKPRHYERVTVRGVLADVLRDGGETLSATADASVLARQLPSWTTRALPVASVLTALLESGAAGATWRVLPDGTIWVGRETWPDSGLTSDDIQILDERLARGEAMIGTEAPVLMPGTTLDGRRVSLVEDMVGDTVRSRVWFEDG